MNRLREWLASLIRFSPVDPGPIETTWCNYQWIEDGELHTCDDFEGHGGAVHTCCCGADRMTDAASARLIELLQQPPAWDDCTWQNDTSLCPRHVLHKPWPAGRDCQGTCVCCNSRVNEWHQQSCPHYDPAAIAAADTLDRHLRNL